MKKLALFFTLIVVSLPIFSKTYLGVCPPGSIITCTSSYQVTPFDFYVDWQVLSNTDVMGEIFGVQYCENQLQTKIHINSYIDPFNTQRDYTIKLKATVYNENGQIAKTDIFTVSVHYPNPPFYQEINWETFSDAYIDGDGTFLGWLGPIIP